MGVIVPHYPARSNGTFEDTELPDVVGFFGVAAQQTALSRRGSQQKLIRHKALCFSVVEHIPDGWTPEQIACRMCHEDASQKVYKETIYRYI